MNSKVLTLAGAVVIIIGLFLPIVTIFGMSMNMIMPPGQGVSGAGLVVLACAVLGGVLALVGQTKFAVLPALAGLAFLIWKFLEVQNGLSGGATDVPAETAAAIAELASMNYLGWAVMGLGAVVMLVGSAMAWKKTSV